MDPGFKSVADVAVLIRILQRRSFRLLQAGVFAHRNLWNIGRFSRLSQSALMPANLITLPHFSVSSAMSLPKSAGEPASTAPPTSASRAFSFGSARLVLTSLLSLSTISTGVLLGTPRPSHALDS